MARQSDKKTTKSRKSHSKCRSRKSRSHSKRRSRKSHGRPHRQRKRRSRRRSRPRRSRKSRKYSIIDKPLDGLPANVRALFAKLPKNIQDGANKEAAALQDKIKHVDKKFDIKDIKALEDVIKKFKKEADSLLTIQYGDDLSDIDEKFNNIGRACSKFIDKQFGSSEYEKFSVVSSKRKFKNESETECPLCYESYSEDNPRVEMHGANPPNHPLSHYCCEPCLARARAANMTLCPLCRMELPRVARRRAPTALDFAAGNVQLGQDWINLAERYRVAPPWHRQLTLFMANNQQQIMHVLGMLMFIISVGTAYLYRNDFRALQNAAHQRVSEATARVERLIMKFIAYGLACFCGFVGIMSFKHCMESYDPALYADDDDHPCFILLIGAFRLAKAIMDTVGDGNDR